MHAGLVEAGHAEFGRRPIDDEHAVERLLLVRVGEALAFHLDLDAVLRRPSSRRPRLQQDLVQRLLEPAREERHEIAIGAGQQAARHFDDRDLGAERRVDRAQFEADVAAADDEQRSSECPADRARRSSPSRAALSIDEARNRRRVRAGRDDRVLERRASRVPPLPSSSMLSVFASTNDALPWM